MALINLFLLPLISLYVFSKIKKQKLVFSFEILCLYAVFSASGIVFVKAVTLFIKLLFATETDMNSGYYTLIGIIAFTLIPVVFEIAKQKVRVCIEDKNEKK